MRVYYFFLFGSIFFVSTSFAISSTSLAAIEQAESKAFEFHKVFQRDSAAFWYRKAGDLLAAEQQWDRAISHYLNTCSLYQIDKEIDSMLSLIAYSQSLMHQHLAPTNLLVGKSHFGLFTHYLYSGELKKMRFHARKAREIYDQHIDTLNHDLYLHLAMLTSNLEEYEDALAYCHTVLELSENLPDYEAGNLRLGAYQILNDIHQKKGNQTELIETLEQQKPLIQSQNRPHLESYWANTMAMVYTQRGDWQRALRYYRRGLSGRLKYMNMASVFNQMGQNDSAFHYLQLTLNSQPNTGYRYEASDFEGKLFQLASSIHVHLGNKEIAETYFFKAEQWYNTHEFPMSLATLYNFWAGYQIELNNMNKANEYVTAALDIFKTFEVTLHTELANTYSLLGQIAEQKGKENEAIHYYDKGIEAISISTLSGALPEPDAVIHPVIYLDLLHRQLICCLGVPAQNHVDLLRSLHICQTALAVSKSILKSNRDQHSKEYWAEQIAIICESGMEACYRMYQETGSNSFVYHAFQLAEASKSILLQQSVQREYALEFANIPDSLTKREEKLTSDLNFYWQAYQNKRIDTDTDSLTLAYYKYQVETFSEDLHLFYDYLEQEYPTYVKLASYSPDTDLPSLQKKLTRERSGLLEYYWGNEVIYQIVIAPAHMQFNKISFSSAQEQQLNQILDYLHSETILLPTFDLSASLNQCYAWFLAPALEHMSGISRLIIIPDGLLNYLPFDILKFEDQKGKKAYVIEEYAISYANSASLLLQERQQATPSIPFAGFGPAYDGFLHLPYNQEEIKLIGQLEKGKIFLGKQASKAAFLTEGPKSNILHLAMHGFHDPNSPLQSHLLFSSDTSENQQLYAYELYNMKLSANLVVLSACHSGYGSFVKGEGVQSMARAFQYAGCPSTVMSLWETRDVVGKELMPLFYEYLAKGYPKDIALQKAKLDFLETSPDHLTDPRLWANFVLVGDVGETKRRSDILKAWHVFLLLGIFLLIRLGYVGYNGQGNHQLAERIT
ncbi:MAG: CHAT domain-containing tetratricopeptide repeat protein [Bacteroidota bacterium]